MEKRAPRSMGEILPRVVRGLQMEDRLRMHSVGPVWRRAVGPVIAAQASPVAVRGGTLLVQVRSAAWMNELSLLRTKVRDAVNRELGQPLVKELRFRSGEPQPMPEDEPVRAPPPLPAPSERDIADAFAALGGDGDGARLAARALARARKAGRAGG